MRAVLRVGLPIAVATLAEVGLWLGATLYAARFGAAEVAAHTLALRTAGVAYAVPAALLQAGMVRMARAEALGDTYAARRVARSALALALLGGLTLCVLLLAVSGLLPGAVFDDGASGRAAAERAAWLVAILGLTELALGPSSAAAGLLRGRKDARAPMVHALIGLWLVGTPLGLALSGWAGLGVVGLWAGLGLGTLVTAVLSLGRLWRHGVLA
jgi:MATE family multidrug resistance protein